MIRTNAHGLNFLSSSPHERVIHFVMSNVICPKCGAVAKGGSGGLWKPYCIACGWNLEKAKEKELRHLKQLRFALLWTIAVIVMMVWIYGATIQIIVYALIGAAGLAIVALASWRRWKTMQGSLPAEASPRPFVSAAPSKYPAEAAAKSRAVYERLLALPKPRRTKLKTDPVVVSTAFIALGLTVLLVAVATMSKSATGANTRNSSANMPIFLLFGLAFFGLAVVTAKDLIRDRKLLANGDVALAVITRQRVAGGARQTKMSYIEFEFKDLAGRMITGKDKDESKKLYENMQTLVFYNPDNPSENVVLMNAGAILIDF